MDERFSRSERVFGASALEKLRTSSVILFGLGGVGGYVLESLVRCGVGTVKFTDGRYARFLVVGLSYNVYNIH